MSKPRRDTYKIRIRVTPPDGAGPDTTLAGPIGREPGRLMFLLACTNVGTTAGPYCPTTNEALDRVAEAAARLLEALEASIPDDHVLALGRVKVQS